MKKFLVASSKLDITGWDDERIEMYKKFTLLGIPPEIRHMVDFEVKTEEEKPLSLEEFMRKIRAEFHDN